MKLRLATLLFPLLSVLTLPAQDASNGPRPGVTDPAGNPSNFTLFRDQQVFLMSPGTKTNPWQTAVASFDANLIPTAKVSGEPWANPWQQLRSPGCSRTYFTGRQR